MNTRLELVIVIVNYFSHGQTCALIQQINSFCGDLNYKIICADNSCDKGEALALESRQTDLGYTLKVNSRNLGYGTAINKALDGIRFHRLLVLNPDLVIERDTLRSLFNFSIKHPNNGIWGGVTTDKALQPDSRHAWRDPSILRGFFWAFGLHRVFVGSLFVDDYRWRGQIKDCVVDSVSGCCMLISEEIWQKLSGFDERFFLYSEETDLCYRARKLGFQPTVVSSAKLHHRFVENTHRIKTLNLIFYSKVLFAEIHFSGLKANLYRLSLSIGAVLRALICFIRPKNHRRGAVWFGVAKNLFLNRKAYD